MLRQLNNIISEDVAIYTTKRQNKVHYFFTLYFMLVFNNFCISIVIIIISRILVSHIVTERTRNRLEIIIIRSEPAKSKLSDSGAMLFNSLPTDMEIINNYTLSSLKRRIRFFFLEANYHVDHLELFSCSL